MRKHTLVIYGLILLTTILACSSFINIEQNHDFVQSTPGERKIPKVQVVVALKPIERGTKISNDLIGYRDWPANNIPGDTIFDKREAIGHTSITDIVEGQLIVLSMFADPILQNDTPVPLPSQTK
jgi:Flp pilus assembly protein CpaB